MEHPYLFLVKLFELIGLGHFAHAYPHVIYSWLVILLLIGFATLATRNIKMVPTKAQNFFELVISGMEEFMVDITGEEGRWFFSDPCDHIYLHRSQQPTGTDPWLLSPHRQYQYHRRLRHTGVRVYPFHRYQMPRHQIYQTFPRTRVVVDSDHLAD
jgi:hypothetical protein